MANEFGMTGDFNLSSGGGGMQDILQLLTQGTQSPLLMEILRPLLQIQKRGFGDQTRDLEDTFRRAGALRGGSYGVAVPRLMGDQALAKSALMGQTASGMLSPLLQALLSSQQMSMKGQLSSRSDPWAAIPQSQGLSTSMSSGGGNAITTPGVGAQMGRSDPGQPIDLDKILAQIMQPQGPDYSGWGVASPPGSPPNPNDIIYGPWTDTGSGDGWY